MAPTERQVRRAPRSPEPAEREISEPGLVGRLVVVVVVAIAAITLLGWVTFSVANRLFDDDDTCEPADGVECPVDEEDSGDGTGDGSVETTVAPTGDTATDGTPADGTPTDETSTDEVPPDSAESP